MTHNLPRWASHGSFDYQFGLREEPLQQRVAQNYCDPHAPTGGSACCCPCSARSCGAEHWSNFHIDTYYRDLLPAAAECGSAAVFVDNLNCSNMTEGGLSGDWNMFCSHEFEVAQKLGGDNAQVTGREPGSPDHRLSRRIDAANQSYSVDKTAVWSTILFSFPHFLLSEALSGPRP